MKIFCAFLFFLFLCFVFSLPSLVNRCKCCSVVDCSFTKSERTFLMTALSSSAELSSFEIPGHLRNHVFELFQNLLAQQRIRHTRPFFAILKYCFSLSNTDNYFLNFILQLVLRKINIQMFPNLSKCREILFARYGGVACLY